MIKAIVFDMDGVVYLEGELFSKRLSRDYGIPYGLILDFFENDFQKCLEGKADLKEELKKRLDKWKWNKGIEELLHYWFDNGNINKDMIKLVEELKSKGIVCILCTNNEQYRILHLSKRFSFSDIFDYMVTSYEAGAKKPDKRIFDKIVEKTKLKPSDMVFCDDEKNHVETAIKYGMKGIVFRNLRQLKEELTQSGLDLE